MAGEEGPPSLPRSAALDRLPSYPLADIPERKRALAEKGVDVIDLGPGDANLPPPPRAVARLHEVVDEPRYSRYGFQLGLPEFREEVAAWMKARFGVSLDPFREIHPLVGSKEGITHLSLACLSPGDVGIVPDPAFHAYRGGVVLAGGEPHFVPLRPENDFRIPLDELPDHVVERARILFLNYPNNPTAASVDLDYLERAVAFCRKNGIVLVHDQAYSEVAFDGYHPPGVLQVPEGRSVAVEFHSLSKTYNMTGWRLGWVAGNRELIESLVRVKSFIDTGPFLAVQAAGVEALRSHREWLPENVETFQRRRDAAVMALRKAGFTLESPKATMYLWVSVPEGFSSEGFAREALDRAGVVVMPGSALGEGGEGFFRIALTDTEERLQEGARRLGELRRG